MAIMMVAALWINSLPSQVLLLPLLGTSSLAPILKREGVLHTGDQTAETAADVSSFCGPIAWWGGGFRFFQEI